MIRIFLGRRFLATLEKLSPEQRQSADTVLRQVMDNFGLPHRHAGMGLRKLIPEYYECRIDQRLRIVLYERREGLLAYDIMTHEEVRKFLRGL